MKAAKKAPAPTRAPDAILTLAAAPLDEPDELALAELLDAEPEAEVPDPAVEEEPREAEPEPDWPAPAAPAPAVEAPAPVVTL